MDRHILELELELVWNFKKMEYSYVELESFIEDLLISVE
jgi:hypothetical protein